jgi:hypothetical protein
MPIPLRGRALAAVGCAAVAALAGASSAQALSYCVTPATGCDNNAIATPQIALNNAQTNPGPDTVVLGAAIYSSTGFTYNATGTNSVEIDGAGRAATTLHTTADHQPVLTATGGASVTVQHLTASPFADGANVPMSAISLDGPADVVNDITVALGTHVTGVTETGGGLTMTASSMQSGLIGSVGVDLENATATLDGLTIGAGIGIVQDGGATTIHHVNITAGEGIIVGASTTHSASSAVDDSVLQVTASGVQALFARAPFGGKSTAVVARHLTILAPAGIVGVETGGTAGGTATLQLDSSILRGGIPIKTDNGGTQSVAIDYSDYSKTASTIFAGTLTDGTHNVDVDPLFVSATDLHLQATSPVIDAGNPLLAAGESLTDLDGHSRAVAAGGGCSPRITDMGAYEVPHHSPTAAAAVIAGPTTTADAIGFDASGSCDSALNDPLTYAWAFDDGATATGVTVSHQFATAGTHTATVTVTDSGAVTATAAVSVNVTQAPPPQTTTVITKALPPTFNGARAVGSPSTVDSRGHFTWKFACPAVATGCRGTVALTALSTSLRTHKTKSKSKAKPVKIASTTFSLKPGQTKAVAFKLTSTALKALKAHHKLKTAATIVSTEVGRLTDAFHSTPTLKPKPVKRKHKSKH